jgi:hypothetical protein
MTYHDDPYRILSGRLGYPESDTLKKILKILMPEKQYAQIILELPAPLDYLARKYRQKEDDLEEILDQMQGRGIIGRGSTGYTFARDIKQLHKTSLSGELKSNLELKRLWRAFYGQGLEYKEFLTFDSLSVGEEFGPMEWVAKTDEVRRFLESIGRKQSINWKGGSRGDKVVPTTMLAKCYFRILQSKYELYGPQLATGIHYSQEDHHFLPIKIGEKVILKAKIIDKISRKGRNYIEIEVTARGGKNHLFGRYRTVEEITC